MRILLLLLAGALLTVGCGSADEPGEATGSGSSEPAGTTGPTGTTEPPTLAPPAPTSAGSLTPPAPPPPGATADVPADLLDRVLTDAASRTGTARSAIQVVSSQAQTWNDGSLGCPQPGESYIQMITEGYRIMVSAGGRTLDYRTGGNAFKLCETTR